MRKSNFALRLQASLLEELRKAADADGTTINQYINVAVAEKLASRRTAAQFFAERAARANLPATLAMLDRFGTEEEPPPADRLITATDSLRPAR